MVPLRVNVNLKATTVEDLVERRKVVFKSLGNHHLSRDLGRAGGGGFRPWGGVGEICLVYLTGGWV